MLIKSHNILANSAVAIFIKLLKFVSNNFSNKFLMQMSEHSNDYLLMKYFH
jgi:hypothetical protein